MNEKILKRVVTILTCASIVGVTGSIHFANKHCNYIEEFNNKYSQQVDIYKNALITATIDAFNNGEITYEEYKQSMIEIDKISTNSINNEHLKNISEPEDLEEIKEASNKYNKNILRYLVSATTLGTAIVFATSSKKQTQNKKYIEESMYRE